jgi:hypothetical protein
MARYEACTLKHLSREKIVNSTVNFVKNSASGNFLMIGQQNQDRNSLTLPPTLSNSQPGSALYETAVEADCADFRHAVSMRPRGIGAPDQPLFGESGAGY